MIDTAVLATLTPLQGRIYELIEEPADFGMRVRDLIAKTRLGKGSIGRVLITLAEREIIEKIEGEVPRYYAMSPTDSKMSPPDSPFPVGSPVKENAMIDTANLLQGILGGVATYVLIDTMKEINETYKIPKPFLHGVRWAVFLLLGICIGANLPSYSPLTPRNSSLETQVRTWASDYPDALRDRWAWCYLDSAENWSTDQKLREDVRAKSVQVLTDAERQTLIPLDDKIAESIPQQKTPLKETYEAVGKGLQVNEWTSVSHSALRSEEEKPPPEPQPIRRRIFNRR